MIAGSQLSARNCRGSCPETAPAVAQIPAVRQPSARLKCRPPVSVRYQAETQLRDQRQEKDRAGHPGANCCARRGNRGRSFFCRRLKRSPICTSGGAISRGLLGGRIADTYESHGGLR